MYSFLFLILSVGVLAANVSALSAEDKNFIHAETLPLILECSKEHGVNEDDIKQAKASLTTSGLNPCFLSCFLQKTGVMDSNGLFDIEATKEKSKHYLKNEEDVKKFENIANICVAINDKAVSDGNKGCERAKLLFDCYLEQRGDVSPFTA